MLLSIVVFILSVFSFAVLSGYGNPFREVTYSIPGERISGKEFFLTNCRNVGPAIDCDIGKPFQQVLLFTRWGQGGSKHIIRGTGREPLRLFSKYRRKLFSDPNYLLEAVKSCSNSYIHVATAYHSTSIIIPKTEDDFQTVQCVKRNTHTGFQAAIGDPQGLKVDSEQFKSLEN